MGLVNELACTVARIHMLGAGIAVTAILALMSSLYESKREFRITLVILLIGGVFLTTLPLSLLE